MWDDIVKIITALVAGGGATAYFAFKQDKTKSDVHAEEVYTANAQALFENYRLEINRLTEKTGDLEGRLNRMEEEHKKELELLERENKSLKKRVDLLETENSALKLKLGLEHR